MALLLTAIVHAIILLFICLPWIHCLAVPGSPIRLYKHKYSCCETLLPTTSGAATKATVGADNELATVRSVCLFSTSFKCSIDKICPVDSRPCRSARNYWPRNSPNEPAAVAGAAAEESSSDPMSRQPAEARPSSASSLVVLMLHGLARFAGWVRRLFLK